MASDTRDEPNQRLTMDSRIRYRLNFKLRSLQRRQNANVKYFSQSVPLHAGRLSSLLRIISPCYNSSSRAALCERLLVRVVSFGSGDHILPNNRIDRAWIYRVADSVGIVRICRFAIADPFRTTGLLPINFKFRQLCCHRPILRSNRPSNTKR